MTENTFLFVSKGSVCLSNSFPPQPLARLGAEVTGLDIVASNIEAARAHAEKDPEIAHRINYICGRIEDTEGQFDALVASEVVEHVESLESFIAHCARVVKVTSPILTFFFGKHPDSKRRINSAIDSNPSLSLSDSLEAICSSRQSTELCCRWQSPRSVPSTSPTSFRRECMIGACSLRQMNCNSSWPRTVVL